MLIVTEPDVAVTDYFLAVECGIFAWLLHRRGEPEQPLRRWFVLFFGAVSATSLAGGTVHGFFADPSSAGARILWAATLIALASVALAGWGIGARIQFSEDAARWLSCAAAVEFVVYATAVVLGERSFSVAMLNYLPAALFLLVVLIVAYRRNPAALPGAAGMLLTFVAAWIQLARLSLHPLCLSYNSLYHVVQAAGLWMVFISARRLVGLRRSVGA